MSLDDECRRATAFITFRGIYEFTRVPQGLLPSANYFQQTMTEVVLPGLTYNTCEDYIDDLLVVGSSEVEYIDSLRQ